jgi:catechol 2,3-dioxygenase-like lactoylglutathione lyase family enzyme
MGVAGLDHVLVLSDDIDGSRDFYCRAVGMTVGERPPLPFPGYWLYAGGRPCLHIADRAIYTEHARSAGLSAPDGRVDHLAFSATDYADAAARLERDGVDAVRNSVPEVGLRQLFFDGPDGVRIEVNVFEPADEGAAQREA